MKNHMGSVMEFSKLWLCFFFDHAFCTNMVTVHQNQRADFSLSYTASKRKGLDGLFWLGFSIGGVVIIIRKTEGDALIHSIYFLKSNIVFNN